MDRTSVSVVTEARKERSAWRTGDVGGATLVSAILFAAGALVAARWTSEPGSPAAVIATLLALALLLSLRNWRGRGADARLVAATLLLGASFAAIITELRLERVQDEWATLVTEREAALSEALEERMSQHSSEAAAAAATAFTVAARDTGAALFARLDEIRGEHDVDALAVLDSTGELLAWSGEHRGRLPERIRARTPPPGGFYVAERPLFSYLYALNPEQRAAAGRHRAIAAVLLEGGVGLQTGLGGVAERFEEAWDARPVFGPGPGSDADWVLTSKGLPLAHATFTAPVQADWHDRIADTGRRITAVLLIAALIIGWLGWTRGEWTRSRTLRLAPGLLLLAVLLILPIGELMAMERPFSPAAFLPPGPLDLPLARLTLLLAPAVAWLASRNPAARAISTGRSLAIAGAGALLLVPTLLALFHEAAAPPLYHDDGLLWFLYEPTVMLAVTLLLLALLPLMRSPGERDALRLAPLLGGLALAAVLAVVVEFAELAIRLGADRAYLLSAAWAIPFLLVVLGVMRYTGPACRIIRLAAVGWVAATVVLPVLRAHQVDQRLASVERELQTLGSRADPYLEFLLRRFGQEVARRDAAGERGVALVYRAWVASGLAAEAYTARISVWSDADIAQVEITPGAAGGERGRLLTPPSFLRPLITAARASGRPLFRTPENLPEVLQLAAVPLSEERVATLVVPVRRTLTQPAVLEPLLGEQRAGIDGRVTMMQGHTMLPDLEPGTVLWFRTQEGWRGETQLRYPEAQFHTHVELRSAPRGVRLARGVLLLALNLLLLVILWAVGRVARGDAPTPPGGWRAWLGSYRARVTAALFAFFLIPTVLFGAVAYRALAGEITRAARLVAERSARRAVEAFDEEALGDLTILAASLGTDVLYYHRGELLQASSPEALELGLYGAWMPEWVHRSLTGGEELEAVAESYVGDRRLITAFRALPAAGTLAVPVWPASGLASVRQRELAHMVLFAALAGGLLSFGLSLGVGRALAGPIGRLRRAAAAVGAGNLRVRLPERRADEFGQLYRSFNHMIQRLRRARSQELRTARVLAWGEMARQVAHEIKNPLTPIKLSVQHLRRAYRDGRPDYERILDTNVDQILAEIDRLSEIARAFARYGAPAEAAAPLEAVELRPLLNDVIRLYATGESPVHFELDAPEPLPRVRARADEVKEVLINLLENARDALEHGGRVVVRVWAGVGHVAIEVADNGMGIPPDRMDRIFEPSFSSRTSGTGLGLAIVRRIVESWGGVVEVQSAPGRGTILRFTAPRADVAGDPELSEADS